MLHCIRGSAARRSGIIFSSHLVQLVDVLEQNRVIRFHCFDGDIRDGSPHYAYELESGVFARRFGLLRCGRRTPERLSGISA